MERVACSSRQPLALSSGRHRRSPRLCRIQLPFCIARRSRGAAIVETVIALPILLAVILGAIQFGLIYEAKATLNFAGLQAARAGAVSNAQPGAIRGGLARGLAPLYSPDSSVEGVATTVARINASLLQDARIRILNPTREAFEDFGEEVEGVREIPNDRLHSRSTTVGALSGLNIQDANLLRVEITYGHEMQVPLVNWFISRILLATRRASGDMDAFQQQLLRRGRLPIVTTSTVRMQSPARMSDAVMARGDLPDVDRIPADSRPPDHAEDDSSGEDAGDGGSNSGAEGGSSLSDGFLGFGGGSGNGDGGGGSSPGGGGSGGGAGGGGGGNSGSPDPCSGNGANSPFPSNPTPPRDSSPVSARTDPFPFLAIQTGGENGATLPSVGLPSLSVGNPIHVVTGNKYQKEVDLAGLPGTLSLSFVRHYNSDAVGHAGMMGAGWRHGYEASIRLNVDGQSLDLWQADGRHLRFARLNATDRFLAQRAADGEVQKAGGGYIWHWPTGRELIFDPAGRLTTMRERSNVLSLQYDKAGRLERVVDPQRREMRFDYYRNGRLARIHTAAGMSWRYLYDETGNLSHAVAPSGRARRYEYRDARHPHHLTDLSAGAVRPADYGKTNRFIAIAHWEYDEVGRGVLSSHPEDAGKVRLDYGKGHTDVTDAFGRVTRYVTETRDGIALVTEVRGPGCGACGVGDVRYEFNSAFQQIGVSVRGSPSQRYAYDDRRRLVSIERNDDSGYRLVARYIYKKGAERPAVVELPSIKPGAMRSIVAEYKNDGSLRTLTDRGYTPAPNGHYLPIERTLRFEYADNGALRAIDGPRGDVSDITRLDYDGLGRAISVQSSSGTVQFADLDPLGRPRRVSQTGSVSRRVSYDIDGRVTEIAEVRTAGERTNRYSYDPVGRLSEIVDADGRVQRIGYDAAGRPNRFALDDSGLAGAVRYAPDGSVMDAAILMPGNAPLRMLRYIYDEQRRLTEVRDGDGPPLRQLTYVEDSVQPHRIVDPLGHFTEFSYGLTGLIESALAPDGGMTRFSRDPAERLVDVVAPNGAHTHYGYDDFGRRVREDSPDRGTLTYAYDAAGNLVSKTDANGDVIRFDYDAGNRLVKIQRREGATTIAYRSSLPAEIISPDQKERFEYDADGNAVKHVREVAGHSFVTTQAFNAQGRVEIRTLPSGQRLRYHYAAAGSLRAITRESMLRSELIVGHLEGPDSGQARRSIDPMGRLVYGNGLQLQNHYDAKSGYLQRRSLVGLSALKYQYDESGRLIAIDDGRRTREYGYDAMGRLTAARVPAGHYSYSYDQNGNRLSSQFLSACAEDAALESPEKMREQGGRVSKRPCSGVGEQTAQVEPAYASNRLAAGRKVEYDAAGNPIQLGSKHYEYNSEGRPVRLYSRGKLTATYRYNTAGERVSKTLHTGPKPRTTFYLYERHQLIAEADEQGRVTREYLYIGTHPVAMLESRTTYWIHTDHLGTPLSVTDTARRTVWKADYEPFGTATIDDDPDKDSRPLTLNLRFPGQYADAESGTYYNIMRDYDPQTGRYLTPDPLGLYDGTNQYAYVHGNPVSHSDSLGLYDEMVHYYMTYFLALVAGLPQDVARTIAIAAQYIDENPLTKPVNYGVIANTTALPLYHFVLSDQGPANGDRTTDTLRRFYNPSSGQLTNLLNSTDPEQLRQLWREANPDLEACPAPWTINDARYQLYGEFLHSYEDTFAHRDLLNAPYGVDPNTESSPPATYGGHIGLYGINPFEYEQPDRTFNQDEDDEPSRCEIRYVLGGSEVREGISEQSCAALGRSSAVATATFVPRPSKCVYVYFRHPEDLLGTREEVRGLSQAQCDARAQAVNAVERHFMPQGDLWAYNELRTLRMEHEVFAMLGTTFQDEIQRNRAERGAALPSIAWEDLAGRSWNDRNAAANARIGLEQSYDEWRRDQGLTEIGTILQRYNASEEDDEGRNSRLLMLNAWLADNGFRTADGRPIEIESWDSVESSGEERRQANIGWIPADSLDGVLLPLN